MDKKVEKLLSEWRATYDQVHLANSRMRIAVEALDLPQIEYWKSEVSRLTSVSNEAMERVNQALRNVVSR